jgi:hypothetical protein
MATLKSMRMAARVSAFKPTRMATTLKAGLRPTSRSKALSVSPSLGATLWLSLSFFWFGRP